MYLGALLAAAAPIRQRWDSIFEIAGIRAPSFIWLGALLLAAIAISTAACLWWKARPILSGLRRAAEGVDELGGEFRLLPGQGLPGGALERAREEVSRVSGAWEALGPRLVRRRCADGQDGWWAAESADTALGEATVLGRRINKAYYAWFPGLITGFGLLLTFIAILVALMGVSVQGHVVHGVGALITGLSGKFVSSVVALFLAALFGLLEKMVFGRIETERLHLAAALDQLLPRLTSAQLLAEIRHDSEEQAAAFKHFNADLSARLKQSFSESLGPTLDRMVEVIRALSGQLREAEAARAEAAKQSMLDLTGAAGSQLQGFARALEGAGRLLHENAGALAESAKELSGAAGNAAGQIQRVIGESLARLHADVSELARRMGDAAERGVGGATDAARTVVDAAKRSAEGGAKILEQLLSQQQQQAERVGDLDGKLMSAVELLNGSVEKYAALNDALARTADAACAAAESISEASASAARGQGAMAQAAERSEAAAREMLEATRRQHESWEGMVRGLEDYRRVFADAQAAAQGLLAQLQQATAAHLDATQQRYGELAKAFDGYFGDAITKLGGAVNELSEVLDGLGERAAAAGSGHGGA
jgi:hypothetical protein